MEFPTPAVLFLAWFVLTPSIRIALRIFSPSTGRRMRLFIAHLSSLLVIIVVTAFLLDGPETAGMALIFAVGQAVFFVLDFWRAGHDRAAT